MKIYLENKITLATRQWAAETSQVGLTRDAVHFTVELGLKLNTAMKGILKHTSQIRTYDPNNQG